MTAGAKTRSPSRIASSRLRRNCLSLAGIRPSRVSLSNKIRLDPDYVPISSFDTATWDWSAARREIYRAARLEDSGRHKDAEALRQKVRSTLDRPALGHGEAVAKKDLQARERYLSGLIAEARITLMLDRGDHAAAMAEGTRAPAVTHAYLVRDALAAAGHWDDARNIADILQLGLDQRRLPRAPWLAHVPMHTYSARRFRTLVHFAGVAARRGDEAAAESFLAEAERYLCRSRRGLADAGVGSWFPQKAYAIRAIAAGRVPSRMANAIH